MIDYRLLAAVKNELENMLNKLHKPNIYHNTNLSSVLPKDAILIEIHGLCQQLASTFKPKTRVSHEEMAKAQNYIKENSHEQNSNSNEYNYYSNILSSYDYQFAFSHLKQIDCINKPIQDTTKLAVLTEFFSNIAHIQNSEITADAYAIKQKILDYLLKNQPDITFSIPSNETTNANSSIFLYLNDTFLAWHSKEKVPSDTNLPKPFYILAKKLLGTKPQYAKKLLENSSKYIHPEILKSAFFNSKFDDKFITKVMELNNFTRINFLVEQDMEQNITQENKQAENLEEDLKVPTSTDNIQPTADSKKPKLPNINKLITLLETIPYDANIPNIAKHIKNLDWNLVENLPTKFSRFLSTLSSDTKQDEGIERIALLASLLDNLISKYPVIKDMIGNHCARLCEAIKDNGCIITSKSTGKQLFFVLNSSFEPFDEKHPFDYNTPKIKIKIHSNKKIRCKMQKDKSEKLDSTKFLTLDEINNTFFTENHAKSEYVGGGQYETPITTNLPQDNHIVESIPSSNKASHRNSQEIWDAIVSSYNEAITKLQNFMQSAKACYGFNVSDIVKMEIFQTAFNNNIITSDELIDQQLDLFSKFINTTNHPERIEIKSCGKDSEIAKNWNAGQKFFVLRVQNMPAAKPILWEISDDLASILKTDYADRIQFTTGRTVNKADNLPLLEKLISTKIKDTNESSEITNAAKPLDTYLEALHTFSEFAKKDLHAFFNQPDSNKKMSVAIENMSDKEIAFMYELLGRLAPEHFPMPSSKNKSAKASTSRKKGGMAYE